MSVASRTSASPSNGNAYPVRIARANVESRIARANAESIPQHSPGSRRSRAPWVADEPQHRQTLKGFHKAIVGPHSLVEPFQGSSASWPCNPGCAAAPRPWAVLCNAVGVVSRQRRTVITCLRRFANRFFVAIVLACVIAPSPLHAAPHDHDHGDHKTSTAQKRSAKPNKSRSLITWPEFSDVTRVLSMRDYNTRVVLLGTTVLGMSAGLIGAFMLLRKRSLVGDVVSHASLPGIAIAYIIMESQAAGSGKSLWGLSIGALIAGVCGVLCTTAIRRFTRIKEDAAMAIVLSIFFGLGIALFTIVQRMPTGSAAGLADFIYGKASTMKAEDVEVILTVSIAAFIVCGLFFKEFSLLCFDEEFAVAQGWPTGLLDLLLMGLVVCVAVIGQKSVGLLLVVAMLIVPAASARFWTNDMSKMAIGSIFVGGLSAFVGVATSALFPRFAAGATIVLVGSAFFVFSLFFGSKRGFLRRVLMQRKLRMRVGEDDLLRATYELLESGNKPKTSEQQKRQSVSIKDVVDVRSWTAKHVDKLIRRAFTRGLVTVIGDSIRLTPHGDVEARRAVRNHRLWELFLIEYADIAPGHVDSNADEIEHVLEPALVAELVKLLEAEHPEAAVPPSPHPISI